MGEITGITVTEEIEEYRRKIALLGMCMPYILSLLNQKPLSTFGTFPLPIESESV